MMPIKNAKKKTRDVKSAACADVMKVIKFATEEAKAKKLNMCHAFLDESSARARGRFSIEIEAH